MFSSAAENKAPRCVVQSAFVNQFSKSVATAVSCFMCGGPTSPMSLWMSSSWFTLMDGAAPLGNMSVAVVIVPFVLAHSMR